MGIVLPYVLDTERRPKMTTHKRKSLSNIEYMRRNRKRMKDIEYFSGNKIKALKRDNYKCVLCGDTYLLCVHHKDGKGKGYKKADRDDSLDNLITLCHACHRKIHRRYPHCQMSNCKKESFCHGLCKHHYFNWWRRTHKAQINEYKKEWRKKHRITIEEI